MASRLLTSSNNSRLSGNINENEHKKYIISLKKTTHLNLFIAHAVCGSVIGSGHHEKQKRSKCGNFCAGENELYWTRARGVCSTLHIAQCILALMIIWGKRDHLPFNSAMCSSDWALSAKSSLRVFSTSPSVFCSSPAVFSDTRSSFSLSSSDMRSRSFWAEHTSINTRILLRSRLNIKKSLKYYSG